MAEAPKNDEKAGDNTSAKRPTGTNAEQNAAIAALEAQVAALTALLPAAVPQQVNPNALPPQGAEAIKIVKAARSGSAR